MRDTRLTVAVAAAVALGVGWPAGTLAQTSITDFGAQWAQAFSERDLEALAGGLAERGIELSFLGEAHSGLARAQARAALRRFLDEIPSGAASLDRVEELGGQPARAYLEISWQPDVDARASEPFMMFVGVRWEDGRWRVSAVRVLESTP